MQHSLTVQRGLFYRQAGARGVEDDGQFYALFLNGQFEHSWNEQWHFLGELNSGELRFDEADGTNQFTIDRRAAGDTLLDNDFFIRQLLIAYQSDAATYWQATLGKQRVITGKGLLFDDYQWGASFLFDPYRNNGIVTVLDGAIAMVDHESPYGQLRWRLPWSERESFGLFISGFWDRSNSLARIIENGLSFDTRLTLFGFDSPSQVTEAILQTVGVDINDFLTNDEALNAALDLRSDTKLYTLGAQLNNEFGEKLRLEMLGMGQIADGEIAFNTFVGGGTTPSVDQRQLKSIAYFFDLETIYNVTSAIDLSTFYMHSSGSSDFFRKLGSNETNSTFLAIRPYNRRATLFFGSGGIQGDLTSRLGAVTGDEGRGVMAPGFRLSYSNDKLLTELRGVALWAEQSVFTGNFYGYEIDAEGRILLNKWLMLYLEGDLFNPGNYYDSKGLDSVWQVLAGLGMSL